MAIAFDPISAALNLGNSLIERLFPDPTKQDEAKLELLKLQQAGALTELTAAANIINTEAASESWLTSNWRPLVMVTFAGLIVARWFGFAAPGLSEDEYLKLWNIVEFGLGGYVVGRSAEKTVPATVAAITTAIKASKEK